MPLSAVQTQGLALLVTGKKSVDIATALKISDRTLRRWKLEPEFAKELADEIECAQGIAALQTAEAEKVKSETSHESMKFLRSVMNNKDNDAMVRLRSAAMLQNISLQSARMVEARRWRMFVYYDRKTDKRKESAAANPGKRKKADAAALRSPGQNGRTEDGGLRTED
jgi:hypothetical protein